MTAPCPLRGLLRAKMAKNCGLKHSRISAVITRRSKYENVILLAFLVRELENSSGRIVRLNGIG